MFLFSYYFEEEGWASSNSRSSFIWRYLLMALVSWRRKNMWIYIYLLCLARFLSNSYSFILYLSRTLPLPISLEIDSIQYIHIVQVHFSEIDMQHKNITINTLHCHNSWSWRSLNRLASTCFSHTSFTLTISLPLSLFV